MSDPSSDGKGEPVRLPSIFKLMSDVVPTYEALGSFKNALTDTNDSKNNSSHAADQVNGNVAFNNTELHSRFGKSELKQKSDIFDLKDAKGIGQMQDVNSPSSQNSDDSSERSKCDGNSPVGETSQTRLDENGNKKPEAQRNLEPLARFQRSQISLRPLSKGPEYSEFEYERGDPRIQPFMGQPENQVNESAGAAGANNGHYSENIFGSFSRIGLSHNSSNSSSNEGINNRSSEKSLSEITDQGSRSSGSINGKHSIVSSRTDTPYLYRSSSEGSRMDLPNKVGDMDGRVVKNEPPSNMQRLEGFYGDRTRHNRRDFSNSQKTQECRSPIADQVHAVGGGEAQPAGDTLGKCVISARQPLEPHPSIQEEVRYSKIPVYSFVKSEAIQPPTLQANQPNVKDSSSGLPAVPMIPALRLPKAFLANDRGQSILQDSSASSPSMSSSWSSHQSGLTHALTISGSSQSTGTSLPTNRSQQATSISSMLNGDLIEANTKLQMYYGTYGPQYSGNTQYMPIQSGLSAFSPYQSAYNTHHHQNLTASPGYHSLHPLLQAQQQYSPQALASQTTPQSAPSMVPGYANASRPMNNSQFTSIQSSKAPGHESISANYSSQVRDSNISRSIHFNSAIASNERHKHHKQGFSRYIHEGSHQQSEFHIIDSNTGKHLVVEGPKRRGNLPKDVTTILRGWLASHLGNPYPTEDDKISLVAQTGLSMVQVSNWFINARRRSIPASQRRGKSHIYGHSRRESHGLKSKQGIKENAKIGDISNNISSHDINHNNK